jgi:hypothetical protein
LGKSKDIKDLEKVLGNQGSQGVSSTSTLGWGGWGRRVVTFGVPALVTAGVMASVVMVDLYLHENPEVKARLEREQFARMAGHMDMSNPWGVFDPEDPTSFLMTLFSGTSPELKKKFREAVAKLSPEKLRLLSTLLGAIDFTQSQKEKFARLMVVALSGDRGSERLSRALDIVERLATKKAIRKKAKATDVEGAVEQEVLEGEPQLEEAIEEDAVSESVGSSLLVFLDVQEPAAFDRVLEVLVALSPDVYESVMGVISDLPAQYTRQLIEVVNELSTSETKTVIGVLERVNNLPPLLDQLFQLSNSQIVSTAKVLEGVGTSNLNTLVDLTRGFSRNEFGTVVDVLGSTSEGGTFIGIGKKIGSNRFAQAAEVAVQFQGQYLNNLIGIMDKVNNVAVGDLITVFNKMNLTTSKESIDVLDRLGNSTTQGDLLREATYLSRENLQKGVEVMDNVKTTSVRQLIEISKGQAKSDVKNKMASQLHRLHGVGDGFIAGVRSQEEAATIRSPVTVAGVRGKVISNYAYPSYSNTSETYSLAKNRVENFIYKMTIVGSDSVNEDLILQSDDLSDRSLARGAEVFINLDTGYGKKRARRLVDTYKRVDLAHRETAIDTMHDLDTYEHVNAALDSATEMDNDLLKDSVAYTERLRHRLGQREGVAATKRLINIASKVNTNDERRSGLEALKQEREVRVRRILKQVDGNDDIFDEQKIVRISNIYHDLKEQFPQDTPNQRTPAIKLADALASSDGLTLGAKSRQGTSRYVTQDRKLFRINQYLQETDAELNQRIEAVTSRPVQVSHRREDNFIINSPELIRSEDDQFVELISKPAKRTSKNF